MSLQQQFKLRKNNDNFAAGKLYEKLGESDEKTKLLKIETISSALNSLSNFFDEINSQDNKNILIVSHSSVERISP